MTTEPLRLYTEAAERAAAEVIRSYSTSFGLATRLLGARHRSHIRNVYALVRVADEIVDGAAAGARLDRAHQRAALEGFAAETSAALRTGFSSDLVVHAFARTALESGIDDDLVGPFFDAMRTDVSGAGAPVGFGPAAHASYVHGSAEVVGLMCLRVFIRGTRPSPERAAMLDDGATALGAAFQNVNFLRDLADDTTRLGRSYLGQARLTQSDVDGWVATVRSQLDVARGAIGLLPRDARAAVRAAALLFGALTDKVEASGVDALYRSRVRVSDARKAWLGGRALWMSHWECA